MVPSSNKYINSESGQQNPTISKLSNGSYAVCYDKTLSSKFYIYCQMLNSNAISMGSEFSVTKSGYYASAEGFPNVLGLRDGSFGVFWIPLAGSGVYGVISNQTGRYQFTFTSKSNSYSN